MPIQLNNISYHYMVGTPYEKAALADVSLTIQEGKFLAIAGHTGSGKSTLMQHLNGLITPHQGIVTVDGVNIHKGDKKEILGAKRKIGMVFQYPEQQLFEETIYKDIAFGPLNYGLDEETIHQRVKEAMDFVELDFTKYKDKSPFSLSGGQMRRVAMAGILALKPKYLVLDEPTAGLDPKMKAILLDKIKKLHQAGTTVIMVSHNMDDIAELADEVIIMDQGHLMMQSAPSEAFKAGDIIKKAGLLPPEVMQLMVQLEDQGIKLPYLPIKKAEAYKVIKELLQKGDHHVK